jgi:hypothetical protein
MRFAILSISGTLVLIAACTGGAGSPNNLRGGPDGIPNSSTDNPGNGYESPGNSNQDPPGNSGQDSPGGSSGSSACLDCSGVYACSVPDTDGGTALIGLTPGSNGCDVVDSQGGASTGTLVCGGSIALASTDNTNAVETWSGNDTTFTITATQNGQTLAITCVVSSEQLPTGDGTVVDVDGG